MTKRMRFIQVWAGIAAAGAMTTAISAQQPAAPLAPTTAPAAPQQQTLPIDRYVVGQAKPPETAGAPTLDLTLEQAMQMALDKNLELQVARVNPQIQDYNLASARAVFIPTLTASFNQNRSASVTTSALDNVTTNLINQSQGYNAALNQTLPWYGSQLGLTFNNGRSASNSLNNLRNPSYSSSFRANASMPLLANFKMDNQRNALRTQAVQRQVSDLQLQSTIENTKASVRTGYWNLKAAIEAIEIQRRALELAKRSLDDSKIRVEIGTLAPIETTNFETQVANAEQGLLNAQIVWMNQELAFKRLLASGPEDELYKRTVHPIDRPAAGEQSVDIPEAIKTALGQRTDLDVSRKQLQISQYNLEVTKNSTLPGLNLTGSYQLSGTGGPQFELNRQTNIRTQIADGSYFDAFRGIGSFDTPAWTLGLQFTYPIGMANAKAALARAELQLGQSQTNLKAQELSINTEVTQAGLNVQNTYLQLVAARKTREAREKNADAVQTRFDVGMATNFEVVTAQQDLTSSRLNELQVLLRYVNAIADFDRVQKVGR